MQRARDRQDVLRAITIRGKGHALARELEVSQVHADREDVDLPAGIVDVVLAIDGVPGGLEQVAERRTIGGAAAMADVHGAGGVGGDELDHDLPARADPAVAIRRALLGDRADAPEPRRRLQPEIDEPRARDFRAGDQRVRRQRRDQRLREFARILAGRFRDAHGDVALEVAMLRIARALDDDQGRIGRRGQNRGNK